MQFSARLRVSRSRPILLVFISVSLWLSPICAKAILFYSTGDPNYNTTPPGDSLADSGWQFEGLWGGFLGTPIAPKYFITARHIGGSAGDPFILNGVQYATTAMFDDPDSDLRIWRICGSFPLFAQLYTETNEVNQSFVVIGRGTRRGDPVTTTNIFGTIKTNGWHWGPYDGVVRWGENVVAGIVNGDGLFGNGAGELLQATFDADVGANESDLSIGDSGGAVFIQNGATWKLAGISYAVDGPYDTTNSGPGFDAAIFDAGGLYQRDATNNWTLTPDLPISQPGSLYATRISAHLTWIYSILNGPMPGDDTPILQSSANVSLPQDYVDDINAIVDAESKSIAVALPAGPRFYRLRACVPLTIESIQVQNGNLVLTYRSVPPAPGGRSVFLTGRASESIP